MRTATLRLSALLAAVLFTGAAVAASGCSSRGGGPRPGADAGFDASIARIDAGYDSGVDSGPDAPDSGVCAPMCSNDLDCQRTCPFNPRGANCCDRTTRTCYPAATAMCPAPPPDDAGTMMY